MVFATDFEFARHFLKFSEERRRYFLHVTGLDVNKTSALPRVPVVVPLTGHHPHQLYLLQLLYTARHGAIW